MTDDAALSTRLFGLFLDELDDHLERLERGLETLRGVLPAAPPEVVAELFRSAHSLKGAAQATGANDVADICHQMENVLADVRDGSVRVDSDLLDRLVSATDALAHLARGLRSPSADAPSPAVRAPVTWPGPPPTPAGAPAPPTPAPPTPAAPTTAVRVASRTMDELLARAQELGITARRSGRLLGEVATLAAQLSDDERARVTDHAVLRDALGAEATDARVAAALQRLDARSRDVLAQVTRVAAVGSGYERSLRSLSEDFAEAAWRARVVPFTDLTAGLSRTARDVARDAGKQVDLVVSAEDVDVDRALVGALDDVLRHLLRNAVDHGIELPADRVAAGKPSAGTVTVTARLLSDGLEVVVADDGRGVDTDAVRRAAQSLGRREDEMDDQRAVVGALFEPGLSTARTVGAVSGRGVGLDVVRTTVEAVGGAVTLQAASGTGLRVVLTVPLNRSGVRAVLVRAAGELVALPSSAVRRLVRLPAAGTLVAGREVADVDGELVPTFSLAVALGWADTTATPTGTTRRAVLVGLPDGPVAVLVDELVGEQDVVVHAPGPRLTGIPTMLGTAQLEDGSVALVVSPAACARAASAPLPAPVGPPQPSAPDPRRVLLAEDTLTTRELERGILEGAGYAVVTANDGAHALELLHQHPVDAVVSDVNMPRTDGIALCETIRRTPRWSHLPVVLVTSLASEEDRRRGLEAGADAYLTKSGFDRADLLAALERLL